MSYHKIEKENIDIDADNNRVDLLLSDAGVYDLYAVLTFAQIKHIYQKIVACQVKSA